MNERTCLNGVDYQYNLQFNGSSIPVENRGRHIGSPKNTPHNKIPSFHITPRKFFLEIKISSFYSYVWFVWSYVRLVIVFYSTI